MFHVRILLAVLAAAPLAWGQSANEEAGHHLFDSSCSTCHGGDGMGGEHGPAIAKRLRRLEDQQVTELIQQGRLSRGMPAFPNLTAPQVADLLAFLHTLKQRKVSLEIRKVETTSGKTLEGAVLNESFEDLALRTSDEQIHLLRSAGNRYREVTSQGDWTSYNGDASGNRYSALNQISAANVSHVAPRWMFTISDAPYLEVTPVVVRGIMYVSSANQCYALDAGSGRELWHFRRDRTKGVGGGGGSGINRGVAWEGNRIFMVTDNAHLIALNRFTGELEWETPIAADWRQNYDATSAPLIAGNLVIAGTAGGEGGARGFLTAFEIATGKEVWRFWTVPAPGEPGSETWRGKAIAHGGAVTWFTGSYDKTSDVVFWQTGNPGPDYNGLERQGDNLYSDSVIALNRKTGKLKWYYQFTPHDTHDWDATEPLLLVDTNWHGQPRKLLVTANRNGFFYIFDRVEGQLLLAKPFVQKLNWATGIGKDNRPILAALEKTADGTKVCPSQDGATNWYSSAYSPMTGLFYFQTLEKCDVYIGNELVEWEAGKSYLGGSQRMAPGEVPRKFLRAIDIQTGKIVWEHPQIGKGESWGGTLATAGGLVFFCEDSGLFMAVDARTGKTLWNFQANQNWKASPMTYEFAGKRYVAIASGQTITAFGLPD